MNCQEITDLLDDGDIGRMTDAERSEVEAHLFACSNCAAEWKMHQRLVTGFAPPLPAGLKERTRAMVAAGAAGTARRAPGRAILYGTILVALVAAAMLGLWLDQASPDAGAIRTAAPVKAVATSPVEASSRMPGQAESAAAPEQQPAVLPPGSFTVRVPALVITGNDPAGAALVQKFRDRVIDKLGRVPGVVLVDPETAGDFEVRISFRGPPAPSSTVMAQVDAERPAIFAAHTAAIESVSRLNPDEQGAKKLELEILDALRSTSATIRQNPSLSDLLGGGFPRPVILSDILPSVLRGPDRLESSADDVVWNLRTKVFPISPLLEPELMAKVGDSGRRFAERRRAFAALLSIALRRGKLPAVDAAVVRAGAEFALTAADSSREVENLWNALALTRNPELVPYLIRALDSAPTDMRLYLVKILASTFADDPRARAALEAASQQNSATIVRMAAARESQDKSRWNEYVVATLNDANLSDLQRLQPIADMAPDNDTFLAPGRMSSGFQLDDKAARELGVVIQRVVRIPDGNSRFPTAEINMASSALRVLSMMETPAASDVMVEVLRATDRPGRLLQGSALTVAVQQFPNDPRVRAALTELASSTDAGLPGMMAKMAVSSMESSAKKENLPEDKPQSPTQ